MELFKKLQAKRDSMKPEKVTLDDLGVDVEILPPLLSHRVEIINMAKGEDSSRLSFLIIAICLSEKGQRQIDALGFEEIFQNLDLLSEADFFKLYERCNEISKVTQKDVEDAEKN